jgi:CHASE2 domain-containing sensor protein
MEKIISFWFLLLVISFSSCDSKKKVKDIVIVDVADFGREIIAKEIAIIDSLNHKVIAIDLQFSTRKSPQVDSIFKSTLDRCENVIMVSVIQDDYTAEDIEYSGLIGSLPEFLTAAKTGFANAILEDDEFQTLKKFSVAERVNGKTEYHFAIRAAMAFDSLKTMSFVKSNAKIIDVNYFGNVEAFKIFSAYDVLNKKVTHEDIEGKIVLFGTFSPHDNDIFFSPLNNKKRPYKPDMYGVIYIANIIAQVLNHPPDISSGRDDPM